MVTGSAYFEARQNQPKVCGWLRALNKATCGFSFARYSESSWVGEAPPRNWAC